MRCPDCHTEIKYSQTYCPHCSAELNRRKVERSEFNWRILISAKDVMRG